MYINRLKIKLSLLLLVMSFNVFANDEHQWQVHGFISQGMIAVDGSNFVIDDNKMSTRLTEIGINTSYQLNDNLRLAGQAVYLNGGNRYAEGVRVDYLLLDWNIFNNDNWKTNVYLGRFKNYHWLYSSTRDVPMTRPSIILPQSVYFDGTRDMSVGGDGIAIKSVYNHGDFGDFDFNISSGKLPISEKTARIIMGPYSNGDLTHENDLQASVYWRPSFSPWRFGVALTSADFSYDAKETSIFVSGGVELERRYANAEYQGENWTFSVELLQEQMAITNVLLPNFNRKTIGQGGYYQAQYKLSANVQLLGRYEHYYVDKNDKNGAKLEAATYGFVPHYFGYQRDFTVGFNIDLANHLKLQLEHHWVKGTARLTPIVIPDPTVNNQEYWQISTLQMTYWF